MNNEITISELQKLSVNDYILIDIRSKYDFAYGHINNSVNIPQDEIENADFPKDKKLIICCRSGLISRETADILCDKGYDA